MIEEILKDISDYRVGLEDEFGEDIFDEDDNLIDPVTGRIIRTESEFRARMTELESIAGELLPYVLNDDDELPKRRRIYATIKRRLSGKRPTYLVCDKCGTMYSGMWVTDEEVGTERRWPCQKCDCLFKTEIRRYAHEVS
jgi:hypothetical protein